MKTLELKNLTHYLPFSLEGFNKENLRDFGVCENTLEKLIGISNGYVYTDKNDYLIEYFKPLLKPLTWLTKEICIDGDIFVPIERLFEIENPQHTSKGRKYYYTETPRFITCSGNWCSAETKINIIETQYIPYWIGEKLSEWHFDWKDQLINDNLAIDLNKI